MYGAVPGLNEIPENTQGCQQKTSSSLRIGRQKDWDSNPLLNSREQPALCLSQENRQEGMLVGRERDCLCTRSLLACPLLQWDVYHDACSEAE